VVKGGWYKACGLVAHTAVIAGGHMVWRGCLPSGDITIVAGRAVIDDTGVVVPGAGEAAPCRMTYATITTQGVRMRWRGIIDDPSRIGAIVAGFAGLGRQVKITVIEDRVCETTTRGMTDIAIITICRRMLCRSIRRTTRALQVLRRAISMT